MDWPLLLLITFFAATLQSATGFGFGLIAVPAYLLIINSTDAIQLVIIITLIMSFVHWFKLRGLGPVNMLKWTSIGCFIGFPIGIYGFSQFDINIIKLIVAYTIIAISILNGYRLFKSKKGNSPAPTKEKPINSLGVGIASGTMASIMAMPGPAMMLYLSRTALSKDEIRSTIITFFIISYGGALIIQAAVIGIEVQTWYMAALLTPSALIGVAVGHIISKKINPQYFKVLVLIILILTGLFMLVNL